MIYLLIAICVIFTFTVLYMLNSLIKSVSEENKKLREFIDKNIHERVVYTTQDVGYTNVDKVENIQETEPEEETVDLTAEMLFDIENNKHKEGE